MVSLLHLSHAEKPSIIIPTYNEIENIEKMFETVMNLERTFDVLIVDDGSPDGTAVVYAMMAKYDGRIHLEKAQVN